MLERLMAAIEDREHRLTEIRRSLRGYNAQCSSEFKAISLELNALWDAVDQLGE